jgi:hypothetical protein
MRKVAFCFIILLTAGIACSVFGRRSIPDGPVEHSVILSGAHSAVDSFQVRLVTDRKEWEKTWQEATGREEPLPNIPTVDFKRQYVIAAFMGERRSSGYRIEISSIVKKGRTLEVVVKKYETPGMLTVITDPFTLVRIPRGNFQLEIIEETVQ